jgi:predicted RNase H-like nuclease
VKFIGVDLAWSDKNPSGVALLEDKEVLFCETITGVHKICQFINQHPDAVVAVDAPLNIPNLEGNRQIEIDFLKDYSKYKLGVYPVNRKLLEHNGIIAGELLANSISQVLGKTLFEVYPHVTILNLFHKKVLPYKRKKGRNTQFIREQLNILQNYLNDNISNMVLEDISTLKGKSLKNHEDKLDSLVCAYTAFYCHSNPHELYGGIFQVPKTET